MVRKRSGKGLSKPKRTSSSAMKSGSRPCAPRYLPPKASLLPVLERVSLVPVRVTRPVMSAPTPVSCEMICSTGPPGATWMITKLITMIANSVGIISSSLRTM